MLIAISQSGETADTLAALREGKEKGALCLGIVNVVGSTIARETGGGIYLHAGPEIGVASTKAFTCQCVVLTMLSLFLGRRRYMSQSQCQEIIDGLCRHSRADAERARPERADQADRRRNSATTKTGCSWAGDIIIPSPWKGR